MKISDRIEIDFDSNEILLLEPDDSVKKNKVEPRIMRVFQILIENSPNVVSREYLIDQVWDNYGGADEALTQAISHLRRTLKDTNKEDRLIETVVKRGYRFNGAKPVQANQLGREPSNKKLVFLFSLAVILFIFAGYLLLTRNSQTEEAAAPQPDTTSTMNAPTPAPQETPAPSNSN